MHKIDEILKALGATGAPAAAGDHTVKVAAALNQDAQDNNVLTKTEPAAAPAETPIAAPATPAAETPATPAQDAQPDLVSLVRSLAEVVQENNTVMTTLTNEFSEIRKTLARNEEAIAKLTDGTASSGLISRATSEAERETIQRTKDKVESAKEGQTELKFSPSGAVIRPRTPVN